MKTTSLCTCMCLGVLLGICLSQPIEAQGIIGAERPSLIVKGHEAMEQDFKAGKTNDLPLLKMDWFSDQMASAPEYYTIHWFYLNPSGAVKGGTTSISNPTYWETLNKTDLALLSEAMEKLPEPPKETLPYERQIVISGVRSNTWFHAVYVRANIPKEVMEVYKRSKGAMVEPCKP